jgi:hypothetical protein
MKEPRRTKLAKELYFAYSDAENEVEKNKLKDIAYELGLLMGESFSETVELNNLKIFTTNGINIY